MRRSPPSHVNMSSKMSREEGITRLLEQTPKQSHPNSSLGYLCAGSPSLTIQNDLATKCGRRHSQANQAVALASPSHRWSSDQVAAMVNQHQGANPIHQSSKPQALARCHATLSNKIYTASVGRARTVLKCPKHITGEDSGPRDDGLGEVSAPRGTHVESHNLHLGESLISVLASKGNGRRVSAPCRDWSPEPQDSLSTHVDNSQIRDQDDQVRAGLPYGPGSGRPEQTPSVPNYPLRLPFGQARTRTEL